MSDLATYDYRGLGLILRDRLMADGRGWRACAAEIGVTSPDLSRITSGQHVSAPKVIAVCDWLGVSFRGFYAPRAGCPFGDPADALVGDLEEARRRLAATDGGTAAGDVSREKH